MFFEQAAFDDARRSPLSILILDDLERILGYAPAGPAYNNGVLQVLLSELKRPAPAGRKMMVVGTTSCAEEMAALGAAGAFSAAQAVRPLSGSEARRAPFSFSHTPFPPSQRERRGSAHARIYTACCLCRAALSVCDARV